MESEIKFRTSAMGYNKNDVNEYIEQMTQDYQDKIKEKDDEIVKLRNQLKEFKAQAEENTKETYDSTEDKSKIAEVLIKAQTTAESIIEEARETASAEKRRIEQEIEHDREKIVDMKAELKKLRATVTETLRLFQSELDNLVKDDTSVGK